MTILDFFRKRKEREKLKKVIFEKDVVTEKDADQKEEKTESKKIVLGSSKSAGIFLLKPHVTEKTSNLADHGVYVFRILNSVTKNAVAQKVEELYKVRVERVNIINIPSRRRRFGRTIGRRPGYKKALIKLKSGQKIEFV